MLLIRALPFQGVLLIGALPFQGMLLIGALPFQGMLLIGALPSQGMLLIGVADLYLTFNKRFSIPLRAGDRWFRACGAYLRNLN